MPTMATKLEEIIGPNLAEMRLRYLCPNMCSSSCRTIMTYQIKHEPRCLVRWKSNGRERDKA